MDGVDRLLAGKPDLRKRFVEMAGDPGVSGDALLAAMNAAGIPARRSAVYHWKRRYRIVRTQHGSLRARVCQAVMKLGRAKLYKLAAELGVSVDRAADE